jgi:hypothetical protein
MLLCGINVRLSYNTTCHVMIETKILISNFFFMGLKLKKNNFFIGTLGLGEYNRRDDSDSLGKIVGFKFSDWLLVSYRQCVNY